jgi:hypothetical protein
MPTWNDILAEVGKAGSTHDIVRRKYLKKLAARTKKKRHCVLFGVATKG